MKHLLAILALSGMVVSALALREHYRTDTSPCSINERWDCGIVNHSPYATLGGIPVAVIGIAGYFLLGVLALRRAYRSLLAAALPGLAFSLYLAHIEAHVLGVWCVYCVASLGVISAISLLALGTTIIRLIRKNPATPTGARDRGVPNFMNHKGHEVTRRANRKTGRCPERLGTRLSGPLTGRAGGSRGNRAKEAI
jgi:vitamin-K-epoxide reductase (warfarin-sensitive)